MRKTSAKVKQIYKPFWKQSSSTISFISNYCKLLWKYEKLLQVQVFKAVHPKQLKFLNKLMPSSWHTPHTFKGVATRIRRTCSTLWSIKNKACDWKHTSVSVAMKPLKYKHLSTGCQTKIDRLVTAFQWWPHTTKFCRISTLFLKNISPFFKDPSMAAFRSP